MLFVSAIMARQEGESDPLTLIRNRSATVFFTLAGMILLAPACTTVTYES
jgi:hypothetical protein